MEYFVPEKYEDGFRYRIVSKDQDASYWVICSRELLDDVVGDDRTDQSSMDWIATNIAELNRAWSAKLFGGQTREPFNRIVVREIE